MGESPAWDIEPARTHEWNVSVQKGLPFNSALTVSYVGTRLRDQVSLYPVQRGAARAATRTSRRPSRTRRSARSTCWRTAATAEYNGLQIKWERRFADGLSFTGSYSLAKDTSDTVAADETGRIQPFVPAGYLRGRSANDRRHMLWINAVYELPFGRDKRFLNDAASGGRTRSWAAGS